MKSLLTCCHAAGLLLALLGTGAAAQTLGAARASAWIGQPLDFSAPVRSGAAALDEACLAAEVAYGSQRLPPQRVTATLEGPPERRRVRVLGETPIDEPVVQVRVRIGCRASMTRDYTVLAEPLPPGAGARADRALPPAAAALAPARPAAVSPRRAGSSDPVAPAPVSAPAAQAPVRGTRVPEERRAQAEPVAAAGSRRAPAAAAAVRRPAPTASAQPTQRTPDQPAVAGGEPSPSRVAAAGPVRHAGSDTLALKAAAAPTAGQDPARPAAAAQDLERGVGTGPGRAPGADAPGPAPLLRVSAQLDAPAGDATRRQAAGALWQALQAPPQALLRTATTLSELESELASLRVAAARTRGELASLRGTAGPAFLPQQLFAQAAPAGGVLLVAALVAAFLLWSRGPLRTPAGATPRWTGRFAPRLDAALARRGATAVPEPRLAPGAAGGEGAAGEPMPAAAEAAAADLSAATATAGAPMQVLRTPALAAALQQSEFLAHLGLHDAAADVLQSYLQDAATPAPLAWHALMLRYAENDDGVGLAALRRRYAQRFGVEPPPLEHLRQPEGIDAHGDWLAPLVADWPEAAVLQRIEDELFAPPATAPALGVAAWRDLLWLHEIAQVLQDAAPADDAEEGPLAPWAEAEPADTGGALGLDLDLDQQPAQIQARAAVGTPAPPPELPPLEFTLDDSPGPKAAPARPPEDAGEDLMSAAFAAEGRRAFHRRA